MRFTVTEEALMLYAYHLYPCGISTGSGTDRAILERLTDQGLFHRTELKDGYHLTGDGIKVACDIDVSVKDVSLSCIPKEAQ